MAYIRKSVRIRQEQRRGAARSDYTGRADIPFDCTKLCGEYKYIVYDHDGSQAMYVFPTHVLHCDVASTRCRNSHVFSAGFVIVGLLEVDECRGISKSLDLASRPEDIALLATAKFIEEI